MKVSVEHVRGEAVEAFDFDLLGEGIAALVRGLPEPDEIHLVLTGDFTQSVRARLTEAEGRSDYSAERHTGVAAGKTFPGEGANATIVINAALIVRGAGDVLRDFDVRRTFSHEGRHAALHQRRESTHDARRRRPLARAEGMFVAMAGTMIEEYRVERAVCAEGMPPGRVYIDGLSCSVPRIHAAMAAAAHARWNGGDIRPCIEAVIGGFEQLATQLAYVAAHVAATEEKASLDAISATPEWERLVGSRWARLQELLSRVPSAGEAWRPDALIEAVDQLATELRQWLESVGFSLEDRDGGNCWFDFTRHDW